jgi:hypothetical protein
VREPEEVSLLDRAQHLGHRALDYLVFQGGHAERAPTSIVDEAMPEFELRSGVGFAHRTYETVEGNEMCGGKGRTRRPLA